ncbi:MAG: M28 family peptidase [Candidatus Rariloculaceae bacterium]
MVRALLSTIFALLLPIAVAAQGMGTLHDEREIRLADVQQLTFGGENAEAYWSPDGTELIFQATRAPSECDQIYRMPISDPAAMSLVSTGQGRTTCGYFSANGDRVIYSSTHASNTQCPAPPDISRGYVWPIYETYQIYSANPDGSDLVALTDTDSYDAEATVCSVDGSIVFTSMRDGDLDLYRMDADGSNVTRLTETPGYDGGAFFSPDCSQIVWRASRPSGSELEEYQQLLNEGLIRPGELELWVAESDGSEARQITYLGGANFAPFFFPDGERVIFSSNHDDPSGREFNIWAVNVDGTGLEQISYTPGFDGFPMFSPDGEWLAFGSNRNQGAPGDTDVYLARWVDEPAVASVGSTDRYLADVAWLADDARGGRGIGTPGLEAAADWIEARFEEIGLEPAAGDGTYRQRFEAVVSVEQGDSTSLSIDGDVVPLEDFVVPGYSANVSLTAPVVFAGWGIDSDEHEINDYEGVDVEGRIALVRRYTPKDGEFEDEQLQRRYGDIRYKAFTAREYGAIGLLVADLPVDAEDQDEPPLPALHVDPQGGAGVPIAVIKRDWAERLVSGVHEVSISTELVEQTTMTENIIGRISARERLPGVVLLGAHYDHLGLGERFSLEPDSEEPHNGADDNASGTAALIEAARIISARRDELDRDVVFVAFTGEETGLLGSSHLTREPPPGTAPEGLVAMLNMDMVGRLRNNRVSVLGSESAEEWDEVIEPVCNALAMGCQLGGDGYGPSDQMPFYAAGVPVLHFFTGAHEDYHKPTDDTAFINAAGGVRIANLVADVALNLTTRDGLTYRDAEAPAPVGDVRSYGASLGTIPDYTGSPDNRPGMLLSGVRSGGPADLAGLERGDRVVELAGREVRDIYDLMYVLRVVRPGEESTVVFERQGERIQRDVTFGESSGIR